MTEPRTALPHDDPDAVHFTADDADNLMICGQQGPEKVRTTDEPSVTCAFCIWMGEQDV